MTFSAATGWWTAQRELDLRLLWDEGISAKVIAHELGTTKNAVIGKANRLRLEPRVSPIVRRKPGKWA